MAPHSACPHRNRGRYGVEFWSRRYPLRGAKLELFKNQTNHANLTGQPCRSDEVKKKTSA
ncbi:hypothetical protein HanHA300_Chr13g0499781 [Helianthus annuus]|nr:hypothetical protein HanHA300_Chr13g0499781 [Helianthus annuus]